MAEKSALSLLIFRFYKFRGTVVQWSGSCPAGNNVVVKFKSRRGNFVFFCTFFGSDFVFVFVFLSYFFPLACFPLFLLVSLSAGQDFYNYNVFLVHLNNTG